MIKFEKYHPAACFLFFVLEITVTLLMENPFYILISFVCAFVYRVDTAGKRAFRDLKFIFPIAVFTGLFNMLFSHYGEHILFTLFGYDFMLESLLFGLQTGVMLGAVMLWFGSYNDVVTSEKIMALFGRVAPNLTLLISMALRFIPLMLKTADDIKAAAVGMGNEKGKVRGSIDRLSALVSISLEKSIETADAMKARGFGSKKRKAYVRYSFSIADGVVLSVASVLFIACMAAYFLNINCFSYYPSMELQGSNPIFYALFGLLSLLPIIIDFSGEVKWLYLKSKI